MEKRSFFNLVHRNPNIHKTAGRVNQSLMIVNFVLSCSVRFNLFNSSMINATLAICSSRIYPSITMSVLGLFRSHTITSSSTLDIFSTLLRVLFLLTDSRFPARRRFELLRARFPQTISPYICQQRVRECGFFLRPGKLRSSSSPSLVDCFSFESGHALTTLQPFFRLVSSGTLLSIAQDATAHFHFLTNFHDRGLIIPFPPDPTLDNAYAFLFLGMCVQRMASSDNINLVL